MQKGCDFYDTDTPLPYILALTFIYQPRFFASTRFTLTPPPPPPSLPPSPSPPPPPLKKELTLSYSLRRYAGIQSYVLPSHPTSQDYAANTGAHHPLSDAQRAILLSQADAANARNLDILDKKHKKPFGRTSKASEREGGGNEEWEKLEWPGGVKPEQLREEATPKRTKTGSDDFFHPSVGKEPEIAGAPNNSDSRGGGGGGSSAAHLANMLHEPGLTSQFREMLARGGRFFRTPEQCPSELVLLVVKGRREAELMRPLYQDLVAGGGRGLGGSEVFLAVVSGQRKGLWV